MSDKNFPFTGWGSVSVHGGQDPDPMYAHITPIYASSTYFFDTADQGMERFANSDKTQIYSRWGNPTHKVCEQKIAALEAFGIKNESGEPLELKALLHASGQAAMTTMFLSNLSPGEKVLSHHSLYGGTYELLLKVLPATGLSAVIEDFHALDKVEAILRNDPLIKIVHIETPANPTIQCVDIEAIAKLAKMYGKIVTVDNTFATPYLQQPFRYDVDFVFHSTTKFLNGHGSAIGGVLLGKDLEFMKTKAWKWHALLGGNANPFDTYLLTQGMKTFEVRMERHCSNAMTVAKYLDEHPAVAFVNYLGLESHPDFAIAARQMKHPGAMLSFELKGGIETGKRFIDSLRMCVRAVSLGTADTLICHPASMTHFGLSREEKERFGITDGLMRVSVGIENVADIISDLEQALAS